jgi:hypothetical protein
MPAKEILAAIGELERVGWRIQITSNRAHAYARAARAARMAARR